MIGFQSKMWKEHGDFPSKIGSIQRIDDPLTASFFAQRSVFSKIIDSEKNQALCSLQEASSFSGAFLISGDRKGLFASPFANKKPSSLLAFY